MDFKDYSVAIRKAVGPKKANVTNSIGVYDIYKLMRHNKWYSIGKPVAEKDFYAIIREIHKRLAEEIAKGNTVVFPSQMGQVELKKYEGGARIKNGKLEITYPVDWYRTLQLWYNDEEARKDKVLVRCENKDVYKIRYNKFKCNYKNNVFYSFQVNRFIKLALRDNIRAGKIDSLY